MLVLTWGYLRCVFLIIIIRLFTATNFFKHMVYLVSYDLKKPDRNYDDLIKEIKSFGTWWHQTGSVWVIVTSKTTAEVRDYLMRFIDSNDRLFVVQIMKNWAAVGFSAEEYNWMKNIPESSWNS